MSQVFGRHAGRFALATLLFAGIVAVAGTGGASAAGAAAASGSPITIAMITSLTGEGASEFSQAPAGFNARIALQNAEGGVNGHKIYWHRPRRSDQPDGDRHRGAGRALQGRLRHRVGQPFVLPRRQVPQPTGRARHGGVLRRPRVGHPALHQHVRRRRRQRRSEVSGQHRDRELPQGPRRDRCLLVRVRHLAFVDPFGHRHGRLLRARRRQGRRARHLHPLRQRRHDHGGARLPSRRAATPTTPAWTTTPISPSPLR